MAQRAEEFIDQNAFLQPNVAGRIRVIALEIRLIQIGLVVFDGASRLLDWRVGVRWFDVKRNLRVVPSDRFLELLEFYAPAIVVARRIGHRSVRNNKRFVTLLHYIRDETRRKGAFMAVLSTHQVRRHFASSGLVTKQQIAEHISREFGELSSRLPKTKKPYQSEKRAMLIFDAAATGIAFFASQARQKDSAQPSG